MFANTILFRCFQCSTRALPYPFHLRCMQGDPDGGYVGAAFKKAIFDVDDSRPVTANSEDTPGDTLTKVMDVKNTMIFISNTPFVRSSAASQPPVSLIAQPTWRSARVQARVADAAMILTVVTSILMLQGVQRQHGAPQPPSGNGSLETSHGPA
jgi:hypothetical protein